MQWAIEAEHITKAYANGTKALVDVTFAFEECSAVAYIGPNGAGKTTTINVFATTLKPTSGSARVMGYDVVSHRDKVRSLIGLCPQDSGMDPMLSVSENLHLFGMLKGLRSKSLDNRINDLCQRLGIYDLQKRMLFQLSWGQTKKVQIACQLLVPPRVLLMDEPTAGLDPESTRAVIELLKECRASGSTLFISSHQMDDLQAICSHVVFLNGGSVVETGSLDDFIGRFGGKIRVAVDMPDSIKQSFLARSTELIPGVTVLSEAPVELLLPESGDAYPKLLKLLGEQEQHVSSLTVARPSLRDAWLNLTKGGGAC